MREPIRVLELRCAGGSGGGPELDFCPFQTAYVA